MAFSDLQLGITACWFTGAEWANGTARRDSVKEYNAAIEKKTGKKKIDPETEPDWEGECIVCGASPIVPATSMCGPCTFGDASTVGGNW